MGTITITIPQDLQLEYRIDRLELIEPLLNRLKQRPNASKRQNLAKLATSPLAELQDLQKFLDRVKQFFDQVQDWFRQELDVVISSIRLCEGGHTYEAPVLTFHGKGQAEVLATLKPVGALEVLVEGLIEVNGWVDRTHLGYMTKEDRFLITDTASGQKRHTYNGVTQAGWYWVADPRTKEAHLADKTVLLKLITLVSDYEF